MAEVTEQQRDARTAQTDCEGNSISCCSTEAQMVSISGSISGWFCNFPSWTQTSPHAFKGCTRASADTPAKYYSTVLAL